MSKANVKAFYEKVEVDKELQGKLGALCEGNKTSRDKAGACIADLATDMGFEFTVEDWLQAIEEKTKELSESDLRTIRLSGDCYEGKNYWCDAAWLCGPGTTYHG